MKYCIVEKKLFTVYEFNAKLSQFDFGHFSRDKPEKIDIDHLADNASLRQSAAQIIVLSNCLPFLIGKWIINNNDKDLADQMDIFVKLLQILNVCSAYEIH